MKGGFGCSPCCDPCPPCEQECVEPHTGDPFETVYTLFAIGEEVGNPSDGYLSADGDVDNSDPYDGLSGSGPYYQEVTGGFTFAPGVTRFPCAVTVSFWRSTFFLEPNPVPPPSSSVSLSQVTVSCAWGSVQFGENIIKAGESITFNVSFPVVAGTGDQSENDPRTGAGTFTVLPVCNEAGFSIRARIEWTNNKRQHVLYGKVRECYEEENPCTGVCEGEGALESVYLTFGAFTPSVPAGETPPPQACLDALESLVSGKTYVLQRFNNFCYIWLWKAEVNGFVTGATYEHWPGRSQQEILISFGADNGDCPFYGTNLKDSLDPCAVAPYSETGTLTIVYYNDNVNIPFGGYSIGSVDWTATS